MEILTRVYPKMFWNVKADDEQREMMSRMITDEFLRDMRRDV